MSRGIAILAVMAGLVAGAVPPCAAAPLDLATNCAYLFASKAQQFATISGTLYPYQWYRMALSRTAVTLDLVVNGPNGAVRHAGFVCQTGANSVLQTVSSPALSSGG